MGGGFNLGVTSPVVGQYCEASNPQNFISSTNEILLYFESSDNGDNRKGFQLEYKTSRFPCFDKWVNKVTEVCTCPGGLFGDNCQKDCGCYKEGSANGACNQISGVCACKIDWTGNKCQSVNTTLTAPNGIITSPGYPEKVLQKSESAWLIQLPPGNSIEVTFTSFDVGYDYDDCNKFYGSEYLRIYDGAANTSPVVGQYCEASEPQNFISSTNEILLYFKSSNNWDGRKGFQLKYSTHKK